MFAFFSGIFLSVYSLIRSSDVYICQLIFHILCRSTDSSRPQSARTQVSTLRIKSETGEMVMKRLREIEYFTIRPVARKGYGSIAHEAQPNGLLTRGPFSITQLVGQKRQQ